MNQIAVDWWEQHAHVPTFEIPTGMHYECISLLNLLISELERANLPEGVSVSMTTLSAKGSYLKTPSLGERPSIDCWSDRALVGEFIGITTSL